MNRKLTAIAMILLATGYLRAATLDLSGYVTGGAKREIMNTETIVTNVDTAGMGAAIAGYVGSEVAGLTTNAAAHIADTNVHLRAGERTLLNTALQPADTNGFVKGASVTNIAAGLIAAIPQPIGVPVWQGTDGTFGTLENGTGMVWRAVGGIPYAWAFEGSTVPLSIPYPLAEGEYADGWIVFEPDLYVAWSNGPNLPGCYPDSPISPFTLYGGEGPFITNVVVLTHTVTNFVTRLASTNDLAGLATTQQVADAVAPLASTQQLNSVEATIPSIAGLATSSDTTNAAIAVVNADPVFNVVSNLTGFVTLTNIVERPVKGYGTGAVVVAFSGLRDPLPVYCVFQGFDTLRVTNAYQVGSGAYQTNQANHMIVWRSGTNTMVQAVTTTEMQ